MVLGEGYTLEHPLQAKTVGKPIEWGVNDENRGVSPVTKNKKGAVKVTFHAGPISRHFEG